jgi:outer membrane protein insertion porin family
MKKYFFFIALIFLFTANVFAAAIDDVKVSGNRRVPTKTILKYAVKQGSEFDLKTIDKSIKKLFNSGLVTDVKVDMQLEEDKLVLVYIVAEKPFVNRVYFNGNAEVKSSVLSETLIPMEGDILDSKKVEANLRIIQDKYAEEKFYSADIKAEVEERGNNSVDIVYSIIEGVEAKITELKISGNEFFKTKKILKAIETSEKTIWSFFSGSGTLKRSELETDLEKIKALYMKEGFAKVKIGEPKIEISDDKKKLKVTININEGKRYKVGAVEFEGYKSVDADTLKEAAVLGTGDYFDVETFQEDVKKITSVFTTRGYAYANVDPVNSFNEEAGVIDIKYMIEENQLVYINRINFRGNTKSRDRVLRREFDIAEGELYNSALIAASKAHLEFTDYYSQVRLVEKPVSEDEVDINVDVKDKMTGLFSVGAGYSTIDKLIGNISITQKNLFGKGYELSAKGEFSEKRVDYTISFTNPWLFDKPYSLGMDVFKTDREYYEYEKESIGGAIAIGHQPIKRRLYVTYRLKYEKIDIKNLEDDAADIIREQAGESTTISFTPSVKWTTVNHPYNPTRGNKSSAYLKYAGGVLGGDNEFAKLGGQVTQYVPLFWKFVGMGHLEAGYVKGLNDKEVPISERFRLGGMYSVRGYEYGDISPVDEDGNKFGGEKFAQMNLELVFPLVEDVQLMGVFFYDAAQSYAEDEAFLSGNLVRSYGVGFRWYSPIGPLRFEYGQPLDEVDGSKSGRWEFSIGGML